MGGTQSIQFSNCSSSSSKLESFDFLRKISEGKSLMQHRLTKKQVVVVEHTFPSEQQLGEYMRRHKTMISLTHQFFLNAFDYEVITHTNICSKQYRLAEYFQYQSHTLMEEVSSRSSPRRPFSTKQIMSILCSCVLALSYFNKNEVLHYTLNPQDIIIDEEGMCKVLSSTLSDHQFDFNSKKEFYYAPETMKMFKQQTLPNGLTNKSGVFTFAVTILHLIHLKPMNHLYNFHTFTLNLELLTDQIKKVTDPNLQSILKKMLKVQTYDRISFTELEEMLFEILGNDDKGKGQQRLYDCDNYQINKLEESILRLKNEETSQSSVTYHSHHEYQPATNRVFSSLKALQNDEQDAPQKNESHLLDTTEDMQVEDQVQKMRSIDSSQTARNAVSSKSLQSKKMLAEHKIVHSERVLSDCSSMYNNSFNFNTHSIYRHSQTEKGKENYINSSSYAFTKKHQSEEFPEYVSEVLKEGRYEGYKLGRFRHGFGTFYYNQGGKYCGEWVRNRMEGRGVLYYASGKIAYEGEWKQDRLDGYGVLYNQNIGMLNEEFDFNHIEKVNDEWIKYQGYFKDDMKEGQGTLFLSNGETYKGEFECDQPNGSGIFKNVRGELVRGIWLMGALNATQ